MSLPSGNVASQLGKSRIIVPPIKACLPFGLVQTVKAPWDAALSQRLEKLSVWAVKNCAPWSKTKPSARRVATRPPIRRPLSKTRTEFPANISFRAAARPAIPAPMMSMSSAMHRYSC